MARDWNDILRDEGPERAREIFNEAIKRAHARERAGNDGASEGDDAYDGMFDEQVDEPKGATNAEGCSHIWRSERHDFPCTPTGEEHHRDGQIYARVKNPDGSESFVPKDELFPKGDDAYDGMFDGPKGAADGTAAGAGASASAGPSSPPPQRSPQPSPQPPPLVQPDIALVGGNLLAAIAEAESAILAAPPPPRLFQRGGMLVRLKRIAQKETIKGITRDAGALVIAEATPECVRLEMARTANYLKWNERKRSLVRTDPLISYARAIAAKNEFPFKTLLATIETPTLRPDGSVLQQRGYDEASGLYFDSDKTSPTISSNPSRDDAARALREIDDVLKDFPFVGNGGAVANAAILTALVRRVLPAAPMFLFDAPVQAAGKSLLANVVAWIAIGREPATQPYTGDAEEDRKRIIATLIAGDAVVSFDNISKPLKDDTLCKVLTQSVADDRLLGVMANVKLPTCTTWLGTGVNMVVTGRDMVRRVLKSRIDPGMERPEERTFDYVLRDYVMERRAKLVAAALTIMRAYIVAGRPPQNIKTYGGFEAWSTMVRAPLVWLGCDDPCASRDDVEDADPDTEKLTSLLDALELDDQFKTKEFTIAEVVKKVSKNARDAASYGADLTALHDAVAGLCWEGKINPTAVGKAFAKYRGRVIDRRRLTTVGTRQRALVWKVETV